MKIMMTLDTACTCMSETYSAVVMIRHTCHSASGW